MAERAEQSDPGDSAETGASPFRAAFQADETPALRGYRVEEILGSGGHSTVYLATVGAERQAGLEPGTRVAIKHWRDAANEPTIRARLEREVEVLRGLEHPHLVRFLGLTEDAAGAPAIVMEAVRGPNLAELIAAEGPLAPERAQAVGAALCLALEHLAARGLVHRDVKPANVILRTSDDQPVLVDFSVTKRLSPELASAQLTSTGAALGTSAYMAPEQCAGDLGAVDARTDLYGVGALLFQALTGLPPWTHESGWERTQRNPWSQPYPAQPVLRARVEAAQARVPTNLGAVVARCLEGDPAARFPDASGLRRALLDPSAPPRGAPKVALAIVLGLCCVMTYGFFNQASWLSPNHGQTPKEEPMKTASLAAIATLTPLLAFAGDPAPVTSLTPSEAQARVQRLEEASTRALRWLKARRQHEGAWLKRDEPQTALTSQIVVGLTRWGHNHRYGSYKATLSKVQGYLRRKQWEDGSIGIVAGQPETYLDHAWATLALSDTYSLSRDFTLKSRTERALRYALEAAPERADPVALTLVALALRSSQKDGKIAIPSQAWDRLRSKLGPNASPALAGLIGRLAGQESSSPEALRRQIRAHDTPLLFVLANGSWGCSGLTPRESDGWGAETARALLASQGADGSWSGDARETATGVLALAIWAQRIRALKWSAEQARAEVTPAKRGRLPQTFVAALAAGDAGRLETIFRSQGPGKHEEALRAFSRLIEGLDAAGIKRSELRYRDEVFSKGGTALRTYRGWEGAIFVRAEAGSRSLWFHLDACAVQDGQWWLTDAPPESWIETPRPKRSAGGAALLGSQQLERVPPSLPGRAVLFESLGSGSGTAGFHVSFREPWAAGLEGISLGSRDFVYDEFKVKGGRNCGFYLVSFCSPAAADYAFASAIRQRAERRGRADPSSASWRAEHWTPVFVARTRNVLALVFLEDGGRALPAKTDWLVRHLETELGRLTSPEELVVAPEPADSIGALLLEAIQTKDAATFAKILRPRKPSYRPRAIQTFTTLVGAFERHLEASKFGLAGIRLVRVVDRAGQPAAESSLTESDLYAVFNLAGQEVTVTLDDCVRVANRWWLSDRLKPGR